MSKPELAREYATLKHSVWADSGVPEANNSKKAHYNRAMRYMKKPEIQKTNEALSERVVNETK